jgi:hypothetical protein
MLARINRRIRQGRRRSGRRAGFSPERSGCEKFDLRGSQDFDWLRRTPFLDSFRVPDHSRTGRETSHWLVYQNASTVSSKALHWSSENSSSYNFGS